MRNMATGPLLAIDIGNTRLKWSLFDGARPGASSLASGAEFLEHIDNLADGVWSQLPHSPRYMIGCLVASDAIRQRVQEQMEVFDDLAPSWVVSSAAEAGLVNRYDHPARLGADRWVAMIGAWHRQQRRLEEGERTRPMVVVLVGTAVTVEAVSPAGEFLGGYILPGHGIMLRALEQGTAGLRVPTGEVRPFPTNTSDALTSGGTYAIAGAIERMVLHVQERFGVEPVCVMTGGAGWKMMPSMRRSFELVDGLIFDGLLEIAAHRLAVQAGGAVAARAGAAAP